MSDTVRQRQGRTVVIMQPYFLPYRNYYTLIQEADVFVIYDDVQFCRGWQQRNQIFRPDGYKKWLTLAIASQRPEMPLIRDARLHDSKRWRPRLLNLVHDCYQAHPHFASLHADLERILRNADDRLVDVTIPLLLWSVERMGLRSPRWLLSSEMGVTGANPSHRVLRICQELGATAYLSGPAAQDYLDVGIFDAAGIEVRWNAPAYEDYPQRSSKRFDHFVSSLDLLMNCGPESARYLQAQRPAIPS